MGVVVGTGKGLHRPYVELQERLEHAWTLASESGPSPNQHQGRTLSSLGQKTEVCRPLIWDLGCLYPSSWSTMRLRYEDFCGRGRLVCLETLAEDMSPRRAFTQEREETRGH